MSSKEGDFTAPTLIPSQVSGSGASKNTTNSQGGRSRRRGGRKTKHDGQTAKKQSGEKQQPAQQVANTNASNAGQKKKRRRNRGKKSSVAMDQAQQESTDQNSDVASTNPRSKSASTKKAFARRKNVKKRGKCPWKKHIPPGTMDPITLDPLVSLPYPPFAIVATEPYIPVPTWPIPESPVQKSTNQDDKEEENRKRLEEQWGKQHLPFADGASEEEPKQQPADSLTSDRHYHLYDGRALAYYLVSQLQFIDPLNRRDLTCDELVNLDDYLCRHGFGGDMNVVEAYDAKGITMSSAGQAGHTAAGRAEMMQQEARVLLNALFGNGPPSAAPTAPAAAVGGGLRELYAASQNQPEPHSRGNRADNQFDNNDDSGIYVEDDHAGLILIDDDANPGLRGRGIRSSVQANASLDVGATEFVPGVGIGIANRHSHATQVHRHDFPSLPTPEIKTQSPPTAGGKASNSDKKPASRSLQRITKVVKKTDPEELQRQRDAREEAIRRAMLSNMSYVVPEAADASTSGMLTQGTMREGQGHCDIVSASAVGPTEGQLERNRNLAAALNVAPSTVRQQNNFHSGWARPTTVNIELDQFGNELNRTQYPDALILEARENMTELLRLEKKWKTFLADDTSASLPLKPMLRPLRKFCHEYSDFWKLHTESFDPEPKRYIHCVKMRDTSAPYPLLSEAARNWRGPGQLPPQQLPTTRLQSEHASHQTAGQSTVSREFPPGPPREPLQLLPRSTEAGTQAAATRIIKADTQTEAQLKSRFDALSMGKERVRLDLAPRTLPTELPPFQPANKSPSTFADERLKEQAEERARKEREAEDQKRRVLAAAFASDSEADEAGEQSLSSGWEEEEQLYSSSSGDEETSS